MELVLRDVGEVCIKELKSLPVSRDLPRLARKFTLLEYDVDLGSFSELEFCSNKDKDAIEVVLFGLINTMSARMLYRPAVDGGSSNGHVEPSRDQFKEQVNLQIHESLTNYLLAHYGENGRLVHVLKGCNQSVVIATLFHVRSALQTQGIQFKDCRGQWFLSFTTGESGNKPCATQRRIEQVYKMTSDASSLINSYKFEWEMGIEFDTLECHHISRMFLRLVSVDFSGVTEADMDKQARADAEAKLKACFQQCSYDCHYKLSTPGGG